MEEKRNNDRSSGTWYDLRTLKKMKLKAKEKINETKQHLFRLEDYQTQKDTVLVII